MAKIVYNIDGPPPKLTWFKAIRKYHIIEKLLSILFLIAGFWAGVLFDNWGMFFFVTPFILILALAQGWLWET